MPKVTVLMAVYNGARYLREAVDSVLRQTFNDFEFLIINDGSTDNTRELILSYDDPRIRLTDNERNIGLTRSLNRGFQWAGGQFIARQDADDVSEPERLSRQVEFMDSHSEVALLGTWYRKIDADGKDLGLRMLPCEGTDIRWSMLFFCPFVHTSVMFRKSIVLECAGMYDESLVYAQDFELWHRIARCLPVANLPEHLVRYRTSDSSMTSTYGDQVREGETIRLTILKELMEGNNTADGIDVERQSCFMFRVLFGSETALNLADVDAMLKQIFRLQSAFCGYFKIDRKDCRSHRARLRAVLSRRLYDTAYYWYRQGDYAAAAQFLSKSFLLQPLHMTKVFVPLPVKLVSRHWLRRCEK